VADEFYGNARGLYLSELKADYKPERDAERPLIGRLALHAESISLRHPTTGAELTIRSPLPKEFEVAMKYLRRFAT
jgi:23S rRNA-/tRNA-specific pseudouridylate synthase